MRKKQIARNPLVKRFVHRAILNMAAKNISREDRHVIHSDLVPRFSEEVVEEHIKRGPQTFKAIEAKRFTPAPLPPPPAHAIPQSPLNAAPAIVPSRPEPPVSGKYGKLTSLLHDPSVIAVECSGPTAPLTVFRFGGQRQVTKISLSAEEIKGILTTFSEEAHVPLMEGVFRVMIDGLAVNAVISELIGSKFLIKKNAQTH